MDIRIIMWSFEGDYRRKPQQRLGGASKTRNIERSDLLNQLKADREERERQRRREAAAVTLQAWARGVLSQRRTKLDLRYQYDSYLALTKAQGISEGSAIRLIALLIRIFHPQEDSDRLRGKLANGNIKKKKAHLIASPLTVKDS
ncbi:putative E3 ubiquitin protein ligase [Portunus trituberculatus]|uniref:Putative E3 ubiquitin protein ligase n=1 Tax=Portunus trituberculatus TaxID=210409 RepID=A0A5B7H9M2_PORTR|nr:putative E3 ubiquitin protein ligase [Portunus trituberculatus]